jgi:hypothetical protein
VKRAARHTQWCTIETREVVGGKSVVENLEFADYDSLEDSCCDYAWLITNGAPYRAAWEQYQKARDLPSLIAAVARVYANRSRLPTSGRRDFGSDECEAGDLPGRSAKQPNCDTCVRSRQRKAQNHRLAFADGSARPTRPQAA